MRPTLLVVVLSLLGAACGEDITQPRTADGAPRQQQQQQQPQPGQLQPYGQQPYGQQPYGQQPYGQPPYPQPQPTPAPTPTATQPVASRCASVALGSCTASSCRLSSVLCYDRKRGCTYDKPAACMDPGVAGPPSVVCTVDPASGDPCQSVESVALPGGGACGATDLQTLAQGSSLLGCPATP